MATALCRESSVYPSAEKGLTLTLEVGYIGNEIAGGADLTYIEVYLDAADQPAAIRSKMSQAVIADATARGYALVGANITLPTFQKG